MNHNINQFKINLSKINEKENNIKDEYKTLRSINSNKFKSIQINTSNSKTPISERKKITHFNIIDSLQIETLDSRGTEGLNLIREQDKKVCFISKLSKMPKVKVDEGTSCDFNITNSKKKHRKIISMFNQIKPNKFFEDKSFFNKDLISTEDFTFHQNENQESLTILENISHNKASAHLHKSDAKTYENNGFISSILNMFKSSK